MTTMTTSTNAALVAERQRRMDIAVGTLLLVGVLLSLGLIAAGLLWTDERTGRLWLDYPLAGMNLFQFAVATARQAWNGQIGPTWMVSAGLIVLMLTPFLRVVASMLYFLAVLKDAKYTAFTLFVLLVLTWSLFLRS